MIVAVNTSNSIQTSDIPSSSESVTTIEAGTIATMSGTYTCTCTYVYV